MTTAIIWNSHLGTLCHTPYPERDHTHMNSEYGEVLMRDILACIERRRS